MPVNLVGHFLPFLLPWPGPLYLAFFTGSCVFHYISYKDNLRQQTVCPLPMIVWYCIIKFVLKWMEMFNFKKKCIYKKPITLYIYIYIKKNFICRLIPLQCWLLISKAAFDKLLQPAGWADETEIEKDLVSVCFLLNLVNQSKST